MTKNFHNVLHKWSEFHQYISHKNRFILNKEWQTYIDQILLIAEKRYRIMKEDYLLYRARIGHGNIFIKVDKDIEWEDVAPLPKEEIGATTFEKSTAGRINPKGIVCLYLSEDPVTAIAEVRPWLNEHISVGIFRLKKDLKFVDVSKAESLLQLAFAYRMKKEFSPAEEESIIWSSINLAFSRPVSKSDEVRDYLPTQYLAESFKNAGYNGIVYASSLTEKGNNIAIFNPDDAEPMEGYLVRIDKIKYEHTKHGNRLTYKKD